MKLICPQTKCSHWHRTKKYPNPCQFEAQCWRGKLDSILSIPEEIWTLVTMAESIRIIQKGIWGKR